MTLGAVNREQLLVVEEVTVKASEDIEKGELIYNDGSGFLAMPNTVVNAKAYVALEDHDYSEKASHTITAALVGCVTVQKKTGTAVKKGQRLMVSSDVGEVTLFAKGDAPTGGASTYYTTAIEDGVQAALDTDIRIVGTCAADAVSDDTECKAWIGVI